MNLISEKIEDMYVEIVFVEDFIDVTLACDDDYIRAHKMIQI